jgi:RNA polymerase sigma-B factor
MPTRPRSTAAAPPDRDERDTRAQIGRWHAHHDERARDVVLHRFAPLARRLASRYRTPYEPFEDLLQVARVGLLAAIDRFEPQRGTSFASFAIPTILGELKRYFRDTGWAVHVPRSHQELALRIDQAVHVITAETGRQPGVGQLAEYLEVSTEEILAGLDAAGAHYAMSLDAPVTSADTEDPGCLVDTIGGEDGGFALVEMTASLAEAITRLPYQERQALTLRLQGGLKQTEIAAEMGCSQMQISRLLSRAAARLHEMTLSPA